MAETFEKVISGADTTQLTAGFSAACDDHAIGSIKPFCCLRKKSVVSVGEGDHLTPGFQANFGLLNGKSEHIHNASGLIGEGINLS